MTTRSRGFTLLEMSVVIAIGVLVASGLLGLATWHFAGIAADTTAHHALVVGRAAYDYGETNKASLLATSGPTTPTVVALPTLIAGDYLPAGFNATNNEGQTLEVRYIEPTPGNLLAIVVGVGGQSMDEGKARRVANLIGAGGGSIRSTSQTVITGAYGGWSVPVSSLGTSPGVGHVAVNATLVGMAQR